LAAIDQINQRKAAKLYQAIDQSEIFVNPVLPSDRSPMNIPFTSQDADIDQEFIQAAKKKGFINLKGHRSVGGMRASIYN
ncbi:3-phosphoserine/phosphohydroxythreonine transaminase, partial [Aerococcus urinae]|nr:3-phosphoserine/phosphohydroxythreonine transaminase [Aerococcus urinae]